MTVEVPGAAIPLGYQWDEVGRDLLEWLRANHTITPTEGKSKHVVSVGSAKLGPLALPITLESMHMPGDAGVTLVSRGPMPQTLGEVVEEALKRKLPKLVKTAAEQRVLLIERQHISLGDTRISDEIGKLAANFPELNDVNEIWIVDTSILESDGFTYFRHIDRERGLVESLIFDKGVLRTRRNHSR